MLQSKLFPKTLRETPADADNVSTALLVRGGYIRKVMAGSYTFAHLGWLVMQRIMQIIREEMNAIDAQEVMMPTLTAKELWERSGRWEKLKGDMYQFTDPSERELGLTMTHEETAVDLLGGQSISYTDFPIAFYHFQNKYRHEPRAKSGLTRTREFIMKDLYSAHANEADMQAYYERAKQAYLNIFERLGIPALVTLASGGIFTSNFSHEFQVPCEIGEDTVYACPQGDYAVNKEVIDQTGSVCPNHHKPLETKKAVEVGNIFPLGPKFSEDMQVLFTDSDGTQKPFWLASYGIGPARAMSVIVETHYDAQGIVWPKSVAPFAMHLIDLTKTDTEREEAEIVYQKLSEAKIDVLFDERDIAAGAKFADADLLGIPIRLVISPKTLATKSIEIKDRGSGTIKLIPLDQIVTVLAS